MESKNHLFQLGRALGQASMYPDYQRACVHITLHSTISTGEYSEAPVMMKFEYQNCHAFAGQLMELANQLLAYDEAAKKEVADLKEAEEIEKQERAALREANGEEEAGIDLPF
jgi:hypothetical protein